MTNSPAYTPGPASGARVRKDGEDWTLIVVRELRHQGLRVAALKGGVRSLDDSKVAVVTHGWLRDVG